MTTWSLVYEGYDSQEEGLREALCTLGNGYFATRGAGEEAAADGVRYPGTYVAGGYSRLVSKVADRPVENEDLVNFPNWLPLRFRPEDGDWFDPERDTVLGWRQVLDLRSGVLERTVRLRDARDRETELASRRLVSMADPHIAAIELRITPLNWSGRIEVWSVIDYAVTNAGVARYRALDGAHLQPVDAFREDDGRAVALVRTRQSRLHVAEAARTEAWTDHRTMHCPRRPVLESGRVGEVLTLDAAQDTPVTVEKTVALYTSRDRAISEPSLEASEAVRDAPRFAELAMAHARAWARLWRRADIVLGDGSERHQLIVRLHVFHLLQTVSPHSEDLDVGVPARGLHGEAYRGHVFWDEMFILPFLKHRFTGVVRAMLRYRHRRLARAQRAARAAGLGGALFPWQSGSNGREESQLVHLNPKSGRWLPDDTWLQRHVNLAIAYNVWRYWRATEDVEFLYRLGAEMMIAIARLFASLAAWDQDRERYVIRGVVGPDEYHVRYPHAGDPGIDNNAYTNVMAAWLFDHVVRVLEILAPDRRADLCAGLGVGDDEIAQWERMSRRMFVPFHDGGIISQFEGYDELAEFDWDGYRERYGDIQRLDRILEAEGDSPNRYKLSKQADVLMLFYLFSAEELRWILTRLGYELDDEVIPRNIEYYTRRTSHGSTLSQVVHSWVLARVDRPRSWKLFLEALESDISDVQGGTTREGIHLGAMAATLDLVQRCYLGCDLDEHHLRFDPRLPDELGSLELSVRYRDNWFRVELDRERLHIVADRDSRKGTTYYFRDEPFELEPGAERTHTL